MPKSESLNLKEGVRWRWKKQRQVEEWKKTCRHDADRERDDRDRVCQQTWLVSVSSASNPLQEGTSSLVDSQPIDKTNFANIHRHSEWDRCDAAGRYRP